MPFPLSSKYETWITRLRLPWMDSVGKAIFGGFAAVLGDKTLDWGTQMLFEHLPEFASAPSIALIASERQLTQGPAESTADFATRLTKAIKQWQLAGTPLGMLIAMSYGGFSGMVIVQQNGKSYQLTGTIDLDDPSTNLVVGDLGGNPNLYFNPGHPFWTIDLQDFYCSRFEVLFPSGFSGDIDQLRAIISKWKPAKATCTNIVSVTSGKCLGWPVQTITARGTTNSGSTITYYAP